VLKTISVVCLGFLNGAVLGWFGGYVRLYLWHHNVRRVYLDASKHCFVATAIVGMACVVLLFFFYFLPEGLEKNYSIPSFVAMLLFLLVRGIKIDKAIEKYEKNWPQSVGRLETINYGSKRFKLSFLAVVIVLLIMIII
jgi:hypothetical protein